MRGSTTGQLKHHSVGGMVGCWTHTLLYLGLRSINLEITLLHFRQIMQALHYSSRSACGVHWNGILLSATYMDIGCQCKRKPPFKIQERKTSSNQLFYMSEREVRPEVPLDHLIQQQCGSTPCSQNSWILMRHWRTQSNFAAVFEKHGNATIHSILSRPVISSSWYIFAQIAMQTTPSSIGFF